MLRAFLFSFLAATLAAAAIGPLQFTFAEVNAGSAELANVAGTIGSTSNESQGDFNGDGFDDLAIGVPDESIGEAFDAGAVNVLYGSANGITSANDQFWHQNSAGIEDSVESTDRFGSSLADGDFNGDGFDDLAIGVPSEDINTISSAGAVQILYGTSSGLSSTGDQFWHQGKPGIEDNSEQFDGFGSALAAADFNGDGFDDLAIGVHGEDIGDITAAGAVNVVYGSSSGLTSTADDFWHQNSAGISDAAERMDFFGISLAAGDFDSDGFDDLAIGVSRESIGDAIDAGAVNIIYGASSGLSSAGDQFWHQGRPGIEDVEESGDNYGSALSIGDFNGDDIDDLAVGVPFEDIGSIGDSGAVSILYGSADGIASANDQFWHQNSSGIDNSSEASDRFGSSVAAGDFNGNGFDDLAIGVPLEGLGPQATGAMNVLYGSQDGLSSTGNQFWHQDSAGAEDVAESNDRLGESVSAGDFNNDGMDDMVAGISHESIGQASAAGAVQVFYGTATRLMATNNQFWHQDSAGVEDAAEAGDMFGSSLA
jgi:hypothetical protein